MEQRSRAALTRQLDRTMAGLTATVAAEGNLGGGPRLPDAVAGAQHLNRFMWTQRERAGK